MAKAKTKATEAGAAEAVKEIVQTQETGGALVVPQTTALATQMFAADMEADAGAGMEGATAESFAIPFLMVLQKGSPQVDPDHPKGGRIEGAETGMFFNNVTGEMFDGKVGVQIVPCAFRRVFIRWGSEKSGDGFKGEYSVEQVAAMKDSGEVKEVDNRLYILIPGRPFDVDECDRLSDTRNHFVLLNDGEGNWTECLLSLASTQIKKSKLLMAMLANMKVTGPSGHKFTPPTFANVIRVTTVPESNAKGNWRGVRFIHEGIASQEVYNAGKAFYKKFASGDVTVKYEEPEAAGADTDTDPKEAF